MNHPAHKAFSVLELLVVTAVLALLTAISLPALRKARTAADIAGCQARLSTLGAAEQLWSDDHRGRLPTFTYPSDASGAADPILVPEWGDGGGGWLVLPISEISFWAYHLRRYVVDDPDASVLLAIEQMSCPVVFREWSRSLPDVREIMDPMSAPQRSFWRSTAAFTSPAAWRSRPTAPDVNAAHAPVLLSTMRHPSSKAQLVEASDHHHPDRPPLGTRPSARFNVLATDGHVARRTEQDAQQPHGFTGAGTGLELPPVQGDEWKDSGIPFVSTHLGALGRDW